MASQAASASRRAAAQDRPAGGDTSLSAEAASDTAERSGDELGDEAAEEEDLLEATVAPRRTIWSEGKHHGPNATVKLPASEVRAFRRSGFLVDPDAAESEAELTPAINGETHVVRPK